MATLKLLIRNKSENSNIYVYYSLGQKIRLYRKTGYVVNYKDWNPEKEQIKIHEIGINMGLNPHAIKRVLKAMEKSPTNMISPKFLMEVFQEQLN